MTYTMYTRAHIPVSPSHNVKSPPGSYYGGSTDFNFFQIFENNGLT